MASRDALDPDGLPPDGVGYYPADAQQMESYATAAEQLSRLEAPVFLHAGDPHEYLFVASFDGTSSDKSGDPRQWTAVGKIDDQIEKLIKRGHRQLGRGYVPGPGTEQNWVARVSDLLEGHTVDERAETGQRRSRGQDGPDVGGGVGIRNRPRHQNGWLLCTRQPAGLARAKQQ